MMRMLCFATCLGFIFFAGCTPGGKFVSLLGSDDVELRRNAALQLSLIPKPSTKLLSQLLSALSDEDALVREYTLKTIGKFDPHLEGVSPSIRSGLQDKDVSVRRTAAAMLSVMNPVPTEVLFSLAESLSDTDSLLRSYATATFSDLGTIGVTALLWSLRSEKDDLRCTAASTLGVLGTDAQRALPALKELLDDNSHQVRAAAKQSIEQIEYASVHNRGRRND